MILVDDSTREIKRTRHIDLRMNLGKVLNFQNVLHVPTFWINLISKFLFLELVIGLSKNLINL